MHHMRHDTAEQQQKELHATQPRLALTAVTQGLLNLSTTKQIPTNNASSLILQPDYLVNQVSQNN